MIGEIRDAETARIAIQSALTGHLVFSTVHANSSFDVIGRFLHLGIDSYSLASALSCVLTQRLIRRICPSCKERDTDMSEVEQLNSLERSKYVGVDWMIGKGCNRCGYTGYSGRMVVVELLPISAQLRDLIAKNRPVSELERRAQEEGVIGLRQATLAKAAKGDTSLREVNRVVYAE